MKNRNWTLYLVGMGLSGLMLFGIICSLLFWLPPPRISAGLSDSDGRPSSSQTGSLAALKSSVPDGSYTYGGSATMVPLRQQIEKRLEADLPGFQLRYVNPEGSTPNSTVGIEMLLNSELSFSDSSRSIKPEEQAAAEQLGFDIQQIPIAIDGIAIVVNPTLEIEGLTLDQLSDIFLGQVTNWSEVGGPDLDIQPFSMLPSTSGTANFFVQRILDGNELSDRVTIVEETTPVLRQVAALPGSIYYVSAPLAVSQCSIKTLPIASAEGRPFVAPYQPPAIDLANCPEQRNQVNKDDFKNGTYPLTRRLFVITKTGDSDEAIAGQAYADILLSPEGQALVEEAGFVNLR